MPQDTIELLKLSVEQDPDGHVTATVPVRWCLTPKLVAAIRDRGYKKPYLMIVIRTVKPETIMSQPYTTYADTDIVVVPLAAEMTYVTFTRPGRNEICTAVIDIDGRDAVSTIHKWQSRIGGHAYYEEVDEDLARTYNSLFRSDGSPKSSVFDTHALTHIATATKLAVEVPQEMFAPIPSGWRKSLVKAYFPTREIDQCHFRRRLIGSVVTSVVWMPLAFVIKVLVTIGTVVWGRRNIPFRQIIQPLELNPFEIARDSDHSRWFYQNKREPWEDWQRRPWLFRRLLNPPLLLVLPLLTWLISHVTIMADMKLWQAYVVTYGVFLALAIVIGIIALAVGVVAKTVNIKVPWFNQAASAARKRQRTEAEANAARQRREEILRALEAMTCTTAGATPRVDALPREKRTVQLRYYAFKVRVCRPFAR